MKFAVYSEDDNVDNIEIRRLLKVNNLLVDKDVDFNKKHILLSNELINAGLIDRVSMYISPKDDTLFKRLKLNKVKKGIFFSGGDNSPFDISKALQCLKSTSPGYIGLVNAYLSNESTFIDFLKKSKVPRLICHNVDFTSQCDFDNFCKLFQEIPITVFEFSSNEKTTKQQCLTLSNHLPKTLETIYMTISNFDVVSLIQMLNNILKNGTKIKELRVAGEEAGSLSKANIARLKQIVSEHSSLQVLEINGHVIQKDKTTENASDKKSQRDELIDAYNLIFNEDSDTLLKNIQNSNNQEEVNIISDFIKSAISPFSAIPHLLAKTSKIPELLGLFYTAKHFSRRSKITTNGLQEFEVLDGVVTFPVIDLFAKIVKQTMTEEEIQKNFTPSVLYLSQYGLKKNQFMLPEMLPAINALINAGLIDTAVVGVPDNPDTVFKELRLNKGVKNIFFCSEYEKSPFELSSVLQCFASASPEYLGFFNVYLTDESAFIDRLKRCKVPHLLCLNIDFTAPCNFDNFCTLFQTAPVKIFEFSPSKGMTQQQYLSLSNYLPKTLEEFYTTVSGLDASSLVLVVKNILKNCPQIKRIHVAAKNVYREGVFPFNKSEVVSLMHGSPKIKHLDFASKDSLPLSKKQIADLKQAASEHSTLKEIRINDYIVSNGKISLTKAIKKAIDAAQNKIEK